MKSYFKTLLNNITLLLVILVVFFLSSFLITNFVNNKNAYYEANVEISDISLFDISKLNDENTLNVVKSSADKYSNINVEKMLENNDFSYTNNGNIITIITKYEYYDVFFLSSTNNISNRAKTYIKDLVTYIASDKVTFKFEDSKNIVSLKNYKNKWVISLIVSLITLVLELITFTTLYKVKPVILDRKVIEYDNKTIYKTCFHKSYFKEALKPLTKVKDITTIALFFGIMLVCKLIPIPSGIGNLGLSFTYLFFAIICVIYGPVYGFVVGIFSDVIGYFMPNSGGGAFNLGYTLQAALCGFTYGIFLFKTKVTFSRVLLSRLIINILMNAIYGSFLFIFVTYFNNDSEFIFSDYLTKVNWYMLLLSLPKNILYLLPQSILLYYVLRLSMPLLAKSKLIDKNTIPDSYIFSKRK